jgi:hypothetical protein
VQHPLFLPQGRDKHTHNLLLSSLVLHLHLQVLAVLPEGGTAAKNPAYVCCKENALGLPEFCKQRGWELLVTADKEGKDSGEHCRAFCTASVPLSAPLSWPSAPAATPFDPWHPR